MKIREVVEIVTFFLSLTTVVMLIPILSCPTQKIQGFGRVRGPILIVCGTLCANFTHHILSRSYRICLRIFVQYSTVHNTVRTRT